MEPADMPAQLPDQAADSHLRENKISSQELLRATFCMPSATPSDCRMGVKLCVNMYGIQAQ